MKSLKFDDFNANFLNEISQEASKEIGISDKEYMSLLN
jgi:hypothetical protein